MKIRSIAFCALGVAFLSVLAQIAIPMPWGVPLTLQTFAVAFVGFVLPIKYSLLTVAVYVMLGACGAPVFSAFGAGLVRIASPTGGFILGFIPLAAACSFSQEYKKIFKLLLISLGLLLCHVIGTLWFSLISGEGVLASFVCASLPYLAKDVICVVLAHKCADILKRVYRLDM